VVSALSDYSQVAVGLSVFLGIVIICLLVISFLLSYASAYAVATLSLDGSKTLKIVDAYKRSFSLLGGLILAQLVFSIIIFFGFILLIIPGIIFLIWFSLASYIIINEKEKVFSALAKSKALIKGDWVKIFLLMLAGGFLISVLLPLLINALIRIFIHYGVNDILLFSVGMIVRILVSLVTVPLFIIFVGHIYQVLNKTKTIDQQILVSNKKTVTILLVAGILTIIIGFSVLAAFVVSWSEQNNAIEELNKVPLNFEEQDLSEQPEEIAE